ncbi:MAG: hypothetical protein IPF62_11565 [Bacteroidetes bacterium]|nr:hypothetical protein [Bacteroidota bacterium]
MRSLFTFHKNIENEIFTTDFQFKGFENKGSERLQIHGGKLLDRCFDAAIRKYCLFKGEENLNVFNNPDALNYLIDTFSNISQFDPYFTGEEDIQGFTDYAEVQSRKAYEKAMKSDKTNSQQEREISSHLESLRRKLSQLKQQLKSNRENVANFSSKLNEIENSKEANYIRRVSAKNFHIQ